MTTKNSYLICFTVRTGSNLLCEYLKAVGLGSPEEAFQAHYVFQSTQHIFDTIGRCKLNGVLGLKIDWFGFERLRTELGRLLESTQKEAIARVLGDPVPIFLSRRDKCGQAISAWKAIQTSVWHFSDPPSFPEPEYSFDQIYSCLRSICSEEAEWRSYFASESVEPLVIYYEDLIRDPAAIVRSIASRLGRDYDRDALDGLIPTNQRMVNAHSDYCSARFAADLSALKQSYDERDFQFRYLLNRRAQFSDAFLTSSVLRGIRRLDILDPRLGINASGAEIVTAEHLELGRAWLIRPGGYLRLRADNASVNLVFLKHAWSGTAKIEAGGVERVVDLYSRDPTTLTTSIPNGHGWLTITNSCEPNQQAAGCEVWLQDAYYYRAMEQAVSTDSR